MEIDLPGYKKGKRVSLTIVTDIDQPGRQGIDGVYKFEAVSTNERMQVKYVVAEAKFGSSPLSKTKKNVKQMSRDWINDRLERSVDGDTYEDIILHGYDSVIVRVSSKGDVITRKLDNFGNEIGVWP